MHLRESRSLILSAALIFLFQLLLFLSAHSQTGKSMIVGGVEMSLGMKKEEVLKKLADCRLDSISFDSWSIARKNLISGNFETLGSIQFERGRLNLVQRSWGHSDRESASELFGSLFSALSGVTSEQGTTAMIQTYRREQPGNSYRFVDIQAGGSTISITIGKMQGMAAEQVEVSEYIRQK
jgi:hypothetical protein